MATTLYQMGGGPIDIGFSPKLYDKRFDEIVLKDSAEPIEGEQWFAVKDTSQATYKTGEVGNELDLPQIKSDSDRVPLVAPPDGYEKSLTPILYKSGFIVTRRMVELQQFQKIGSMLTGLPASFRSLRELKIAAFLALTHTSETGGDGSYVFATDHNLEDVKFGTWSNKAASAGGVTTASLFDAWSNLHGRVNAKGRPMPGEPKDLLYHYSKNEAVMKVLGSDLYPQNSLNAKLPTFIKKVTPTYGHYLTDTDMWFVRSDKEAANPGFHLVYNARPTFLPISESMNPDLIMGKRGRMAFVVGCVHSRGWYSNAGA